MDKQLTLDELKEMHGKPVWCRIPSDNPRWGIVDAESSCVVLGANHRLIFCHYGEWKAFTSPDPIPSPTIKPGDKEYVCCECKEPSSSNEWNIATLKVYGSDIYLIEDDNKEITTFFVCPKCGSNVDFDCLEVSHD